MIRLFKPPQHAAGVPAVNNVYACVAFCLASSFANSFTSSFASTLQAFLQAVLQMVLQANFASRLEPGMKTEFAFGLLFKLFATHAVAIPSEKIGVTCSYRPVLTMQMQIVIANCHCICFVLFCMCIAFVLHCSLRFYLQCKRKCKPFLLEVQMQTNLHLHSQHWYCVPCTPELDTAILYE